MIYKWYTKGRSFVWIARRIRRFQWRASAINYFSITISTEKQSRNMDAVTLIVLLSIYFIKYSVEYISECKIIWLTKFNSQASNCYPSPCTNQINVSTKILYNNIIYCIIFINIIMCRKCDINMIRSVCFSIKITKNVNTVLEDHYIYIYIYNIIIHNIRKLLRNMEPIIRHSRGKFYKFTEKYTRSLFNMNANCHSLITTICNRHLMNEFVIYYM